MNANLVLCELLDTNIKTAIYSFPGNLFRLKPAMDEIRFELIYPVV